MKTHGGKKRKLKKTAELSGKPKKKICRSITPGKVAKKSRKFGKESEKTKGVSDSEQNTLKPDQLSKIPDELHLQILSNLDPVSTVCLGLASKKFYTLCMTSQYKKLPLDTFSEAQGPQNLSILGEALEAWIPRGLRYDGDLKFVTKKRYEDLVVQRSEERREVVRNLKKFGNEKTRVAAEWQFTALYDCFVEL